MTTRNPEIGKWPSLEQVARQWAEELKRPDVTSDDLAVALLDAAMKGEFQHRPDPPPGLEYKVRHGLLIGTFDRAGHAVTSLDIKNNLDAELGKVERVADKMPARLGLSREVTISPAALRR